MEFVATIGHAVRASACSVNRLGCRFQSVTVVDVRAHGVGAEIGVWLESNAKPHMTVLVVALTAA